MSGRLPTSRILPTYALQAEASAICIPLSLYAPYQYPRHLSTQFLTTQVLPRGVCGVLIHSHKNYHT